MPSGVAIFFPFFDLSVRTPSEGNVPWAAVDSAVHILYATTRKRDGVALQTAICRFRFCTRRVTCLAEDWVTCLFIFELLLSRQLVNQRLDGVKLRRGFFKHQAKINKLGFRECQCTHSVLNVNRFLSIRAANDLTLSSNCDNAWLVHGVFRDVNVSEQL